MTRKQLEARAKKLKIQFQPDVTDEDLQTAITAKEAEKKEAAAKAKAAKVQDNAGQSKQSTSAPKSDDPDLVIAKPLSIITKRPVH